MAGRTVLAALCRPARRTFPITHNKTAIKPARLETISAGAAKLFVLSHDRQLTISVATALISRISR